MRFSSKPGHDHSETYHYGYRFYLPEAQRWLNRDPIGERDGINLYGYVENNPASNIDPLGLILGRLPGFVGDILCPMLSDDSCRICCALAFQAALVADGLEAGTIIGVGVVAGFVTIGAGTGGAVAVALVDSAISHAMNIKGFKSCLESCKDKPDCDKEP